MADRYLLTHSLLAAWLYTMKENPREDATNAKDPMEEFMLTLRREPTPKSEAMQNGIDFENLVTAILRGDKNFGFFTEVDVDYGTVTRPAKIEEHHWYQAALKVARSCAGGVLQLRAKKKVEVAGMDLLLYGRLDCLRAGRILDIKFSKGYDAGKYFSSTQHPMYLELVPEAREFTYLVSNGSYVWQETYRREETPSIYPVISDFFDWLRATDLMPVYRQHWKTL